MASTALKNGCLVETCWVACHHVTLEARVKMPPAEMGRISDPFLEGRANYVTGSRLKPGGASPNLPAFQHSSIPTVPIFMKLLNDEALVDATCGRRAFKLSLISRATFDWRAPWLETHRLNYCFYGKALPDKGDALDRSALHHAQSHCGQSLFED